MSEYCKNVFKLFLSFIGIVLGLCAFIAFFCVYGNFDAGVWGLLSGVFAAVSFHLHYLNFRERLESWHSVDTLKSLQFLGLLGLLFGTAGMSWYIFVTVYKHVPVMPVASSAAISAVWAFMTAKWGLLLILHSWTYIIKFERDNPSLIRL